jgi:ribose 5-phosphate isomerase B
LKVVLGCDHAAFEAKEELKKYLEESHEVIDVGTHSLDRCNYPDFATKLVKEVLGENIKGILICGSGIGVSMVANRYGGIRAALVRSPKEAELSVQHNNANVLCLGARINTADQLKDIIACWFKAEFEGGRHTERLALFEDLGEKL